MTTTWKVPPCSSPTSVHDQALKWPFCLVISGFHLPSLVSFSWWKQEMETETYLITKKRQKLAWFGHLTCHDSLSKTIRQGTLEVGLHCGQQRKCWMDNVKELTSLPMPELLTRASCRKDWKRISAESSLMTPSDPIGQGTELNWGLGVLTFKWPEIPC